MWFWKEPVGTRKPNTYLHVRVFRLIHAGVHARHVTYMYMQTTSSTVCCEWKHACTCTCTVRVHERVAHASSVNVEINYYWNRFPTLHHEYLWRMQSLASLGYEKRRRRGIGITNLGRMVAHFNLPYAEHYVQLTMALTRTQAQHALGLFVSHRSRSQSVSNPWSLIQQVVFGM